MNILQIIVGVVKLLAVFFQKSIERDAKRKKVLQEASKDAKKAIADGDASALTAALSRMRK